MENSQSSTDQNLTETAVQQQAGSNNKLFLVVVSVLLTAIVTGSAVYFWQKSTSGKATNRLEQKISSLEKQISTTKKREIVPKSSEIDEMANWKTYVDPLNRFKVKYPNDWFSAKKARNKNKYMQVVDLAKTLNSAFYSSDQEHVFWIKYINNSSGESLRQIVKSGILDKGYGSLSSTYINPNTNTNPKFSITTINEYLVYEPDGNWPSAFGIKTVFVKNPVNDSYAWLNLEPYYNHSLKVIFDQILSTFRFID